MTTSYGTTRHGPRTAICFNHEISKKEKRLSPITWFESLCAHFPVNMGVLLDKYS